MHDVDPGVEYVPAAHVRQRAPDAYSPAEQLEQAAEPGAENVPVAHDRHDVAPAPEYVFAGHGIGHAVIAPAAAP